MMNVVSLAYV